MGNAEGGRERRCRTGAGERNQVDITTAGAIMGEGDCVPGPRSKVQGPRSQIPGPRSSALMGLCGSGWWRIRGSATENARYG